MSGTLADFYIGRGKKAQWLGMHYLGWAYICYAEGYKQALIDLNRTV
jgi:hypothetical protein